MKKRLTSGLYALPESLRGRSESGIALILTLAILVLVTLLVVAFAVSMRVENTASKNFNDLIKARQLAQAAVDQAVATIRLATQVPTTAPTMITYVTFPGAIYTLGGGVWVPHPLFMSNVSISGSVDMNTNSLITGIGNPDYPPGSSQLWVSWSNVVVTVNGNPEVVGRFAYWVDDEAAKVDLNLTGTRGNDLEGYAPDAIELTNLHFTTADQTNITNYVSTVRPFDTIKSIQIPNGPNIPDTTYSNNQFYVTVNSTSPDITPWGTKRTNFVDVATNLFLTADQKVLIISNALDNANLTTWFGQTFAMKYNVAQIAANIIDYIDTDPQPTEDPVSSANPSGPTPPLYLGLEQTPYFNELLVLNSITATPIDGSGNATLTFTTTARVELWHMYNNTWNSVGSKVSLLGPPSISFAVTPPGGTFSPPTILFTNNVTTINTVGALHNLSPIKPYDVVSGTVTSLSVIVSGISSGSIVTVSMNSGSVTGVYLNAGGRIDYAIMPLPVSGVPLTITTTFQSTNMSAFAACNDPRVKPASTNWTPEAVIAPFGLASPALDPTVSTMVNGVQVPADGDLSCHTNAIPRNRGTMYPGELSYIHTGVPWRTLWLQPESSTEVAATMIPDWAVLDLFSATDTTNVVGRMNINSAVAIPNALTFPQRLRPLTALLTNTFSIAGGGTLQNNYVQATAVGNVYDYPTTPALRVVSPPASGLVPFCPNAFTMVGEVANTQSLSDTQTIGPPTTTSKSNRETPVRGIANIITTRSDIFTVWAIAQSVQQPRNAIGQVPGQFTPGVDLITGEAKVQAIVQRSVDYTVFPPQVSFRTLYYRYIYQ